LIRLPLPHPLDFDWRYDDDTAQALTVLLQSYSPVVAIGAPTVARLLEAVGADVTLVDRQPIQGVRRHIVSDASDFTTDDRYKAAIVDPPWYPAQLTSWTEASARAVGVGGTVFVSIWPHTTRPRAATEASQALNEFSRWAHIQRNIATLRYAEPHFETIAREVGGEAELSRSPLEGELIRLDVQAVPPVISKKNAPAQWLRITIDDYQLAVRRRPDSGLTQIEPVFPQDGWRWRYVSARAPGIEQIDLWSSLGEVAKLGSSDQLITALRRALHTTNRDAFERELASMPQLLSWCIPRPPFRRVIEWQHR